MKGRNPPTLIHMDEQSRKQFNEIVAKEPKALTEAEIVFLQARRSYLNEEQRAVFADVLPKEKGNKVPTEPKPLSELSDKELAKLAKSLNLDPKAYEDSATLIAAIEEAQAAAQ
jgi:hypothetical protein